MKIKCRQLVKPTFIPALNALTALRNLPLATAHRIRRLLRALLGELQLLDPTLNELRQRYPDLAAQLRAKAGRGWEEFEKLAETEVDIDVAVIEIDLVDAEGKPLAGLSADDLESLDGIVALKLEEPAG